MDKYGIGLLIIAYITINIVSSIKILRDVMEEDIEPFPVSAKTIYDNTDMNMFGCVVVSLVVMFFTSAYHIPAFICWVVYKLFHVGRRK